MWKVGDYKVVCDLCRRVRWASECGKDWQGRVVCRDTCLERKHPSLTPVIFRDDVSVKDARPQKTVYDTTGVASDTDGICASQHPTAAGSLNINGELASGGSATLDTPRRIVIASTGDDYDAIFALSGTLDSGDAQSELITGVSVYPVSSVWHYKTVTGVTVSKATRGSITVGTESAWKQRTSADF